MTRLFHDCKCKVCKGWTQIANIGVGRNICDDYVCDSCKWDEIKHKGKSLRCYGCKHIDTLIQGGPCLVCSRMHNKDRYESQ